MKAGAHRNPPLSILLHRFAHTHSSGRVSLQEIVEYFGDRAFGAVLFVFSAPNMLPLPPGSSTFLGLPLVIVAPQLAAGARRPWLPAAVGRRTFEAASVAKLFEKIAPVLRRVEKLSAPRLEFLFGPVGRHVLGIVCTVLAGVLLLPIPLGNLLPAASIAALALGHVQRDGVLALIGYGLTLASGAVLALSAGAIMAVFRHLLHLLPA